MRPIAVAILVMIATGGASAQEPQQAAMMGAGSSTCAQYAQMYRRDPDSADANYFGWAQGFMSGLNQEQLALQKPMHNLNALPVSEQLDHLRIYCDQKPLVPFAVAVYNLFNALPTIPPTDKR